MLLSIFLFITEDRTDTKILTFGVTSNKTLFDLNAKLYISLLYAHINHHVIFIMKNLLSPDENHMVMDICIDL